MTKKMTENHHQNSDSNYHTKCKLHHKRRISTSLQIMLTCVALTMSNEEKSESFVGRLLGSEF